MFKKKIITVLLLLLVAIIGIVGCSTSTVENNNGINENENSVTKNESNKDEIVTLQVFDRLFTEDDFNKYVLEPVQTQFPNVKLDRVEVTGGDLQLLQNMVTTGTLPDILLRYVAGSSHLTDLDIPMDLAELTKKYNLDTSQYDPSIVETLKRYGQLADPEPYELIALPLYSQIQVMIYNKDIFDMFAEPYPTDDMIYTEEFIDKVRRLTRNEDGVQYYGSSIYWSGLAYQLSLGLVDPETNRSLVNQLEDYQIIFKFGKTFFDIEGNEDVSKVRKGYDRFFKDRTMAMLPAWISGMVRSLKAIEGQPLEWDLVTLPVFEHKPDAQSMIDFHAMYLSQASEHKDIAFQVMQYLSTGTEPQTILAREGKQTVLTDESIRKQFAADLTFFEGKNMSVFEKTRTVPVSVKTRFDSLANPEVFKAFDLVISGQKDVNTALLEADEIINQLIDAELAQ